LYATPSPSSLVREREREKEGRR
jgi:hypothetical protein